MAVLSSFINNGRFIKVEDQASGRNCRFINQKRAKWPDLLDSGCGWPISYCPVKGVYQRPSRAIFIKGWQSDWPFYEGRPAAVAVLSKPMAVLSRPASINSSLSNSGRFIKARPVAAMAVLSPRSGRMARSLDFGLRIADFILPRTSSLSTAKSSHF